MVTTRRQSDMEAEAENSRRQDSGPTTRFFHLRCLRSVRRQLGREVTARLVSALVLSLLDYVDERRPRPLSGPPGIPVIKVKNSTPPALKIPENSRYQKHYIFIV